MKIESSRQTWTEWMNEDCDSLSSWRSQKGSNLLFRKHDPPSFLDEPRGHRGKPHRLRHPQGVSIWHRVRTRPGRETWLSQLLASIRFKVHINLFTVKVITTGTATMSGSPAIPPFLTRWASQRWSALVRPDTTMMTTSSPGGPQAWMNILPRYPHFYSNGIL